MKKCIILIILLILCGGLSSEGQVLCYGKNAQQVALTFDDGPSPAYTGRILGTLKRYRVKATFFVVGKKAADFSDLLKQIADAGEEIGNHTYYHSPITWLSPRKMLNELADTNRVIGNITGREVTLFRPPNGRFSQARLKTLEHAGYRVVLWSVNADDFYHSDSGMRSPDSIDHRVLSRVRGGDVILLHDSEETIAALPKMIQALKKRGFKFCTVSELNM
jgi:peptidoglycan/xylan/chitin deacetylase (PgdA/CDA1 family)